PEDSLLCEIDLGRDTLEFYIIEYAIQNQMPILGICRGMQMMNVATGGSLIVDIPSEVKNHLDHQNGLPEDSYHRVMIEKSSLLNSLLESNEEIVNSNHHQSVDKLGKNLVISAKTSDGVVEAIEWKDKENMAWFLGVQWHPERLINKNATEPILLEFVKQIELYKKKK
ncbi:MAG: gamma-glutamyl-gamma-aminobutyrate hydrolase family protein, partial [Proteobacteria bacterium]|nr:gamma-glutamyl-gamma-aminobutyrate hydrolase family protein [Pseudomonadota bacterium]